MIYIFLFSNRVFDFKRARALEGWFGIKKIPVFAPTTKAALRQLLSLPGLEEIYLSELCRHGSLSSAPVTDKLRVFRCDGLSAKEMRN